jgi:hypothetical protein
VQEPVQKHASAVNDHLMHVIAPISDAVDVLPKVNSSISLASLAIDDPADSTSMDIQKSNAEYKVGPDNLSTSKQQLTRSTTWEDIEGKQLMVERSALLEQEKIAQGGKQFMFDIFSDSPSDLENKPAAVTGRKASREALLEGEHPHLQSNWDDGDGYYKARIGEVIGDRFKILGVVGKGVFSTVLKCLDIRMGDGSTHNVAVKLIRNNEVMRKAAEKEKSILLALNERDVDNKRFCVKLLTYLDYRSHVALVFEYQQMNLREALKKFGNNVGINIGAIRMYGRQLMVALRYLMELRIIHADIKLDNILCSGDLKQVKLCDFGSAFFETDTDASSPTPYLVSRFYRAPEIILGLPCK